MSLPAADWWEKRDFAARLTAAAEWLVSRQGVDGLWTDFRTFAGLSDEWVSGYVGAALAVRDDESSRAAAQRAWTALSARRHADGGWGYNAAVPSDADSTASAYRLAIGVGASDADVESIGRALLTFQGRDGGLSTYALDGPIRAFTAVLPDVSFAGWCSVHQCVTALAAAEPRWPGAASARAYLARNQHPDGRWRAYWWSDDLYATAFGAVAFAGDGPHTDVRRRAIDWVAARAADNHVIGDRRPPQPSPVMNALALLALSTAATAVGVQEQMRRLVIAVLCAQCADGHWSPGAGMRIPPPDLIDADAYAPYLPGLGGGSAIEEPTGCFSTGTILLALDTAARRLRELEG